MIQNQNSLAIQGMIQFFIWPDKGRKKNVFFHCIHYVGGFCISKILSSQFKKLSLEVKTRI